MTPVERILQRFAEGARRVVIPSVCGSLRAQITAELIVRRRKPVVVVRDQADAEALYRDLAFLLGSSEETASERGLLFFGADDKSPYEEYSPDARAVMERLGTLYRLSEAPASVRALIVTAPALVRRQVPPAFLEASGEYVLAGADLDREGLLKKLVASGYHQVSTVEDPGTYSVRGGIIDIFSPSRSLPVRIDLFGDEVESLHLFDPASQRNTEAIEDVFLLPAREIAFTDAVVRHALACIRDAADRLLIPTRKLHAILDDIENQLHFFGIESLLPIFHPEGLETANAYLPRGEDVVYLLDDPELVESTTDETWTEAQVGYDRACTRHELAVPPEAHLADVRDELAGLLESCRRVEWPEVHVGGGDALEIRWASTEAIRTEVLQATRAPGESEDILHPLVHRLKSWRGDGLSSVIVCHTRGQAERLRSMMEHRSVRLELLSEPFDLTAVLSPENTPLKSRLRNRNIHAHLALGELSGGFVLRTARLVLIAEEEIFGRRVSRSRRRTAAAGEMVADLRDLEPGDYVVHVDHGIGQYQGMTKLAINGVESDYLHVDYRDGKYYLPVHRLRLISKYATGGDGGREPRLDKLGAPTWTNTKRKVKDTLLKMAAELLRLYAVRQSAPADALVAPDEIYRQFEAEFPFEPTVDQQKAIDDVLNDLQKPHPMDRLICGDVGYGKTEVALRAAMLTVLGQKQVAVLVPTTVLAAQHHQVFASRFERYPARIAIVSRFQSPEEVRKTFDGLRNGTVDIVIGTHKLLSASVHFKDLGLLIIDEEHRFGVRHKERLKKLRAQVHILSLSATPIPRTLHMGFMGVRDMSMITTPPQDRLAVKTEVHKFDEDTIREAILREIRRGGQVFFVHNRVASIGAMRGFLERLVPEARIGLGHGQMQEDALEKVMVEFMNKGFNVLLSTTIIESGIDIPNANTIIVNRADRLGLAQLYQLRGRVGRSNRRGFAYFLIPAGNLTKKARARIGVLQRFTELGAGFKVASKDLEIRGAGNLLGKQQSGTIAAVGFEMYQALLSEAIAELKGAQRHALKEPELQVPTPALIPESYIKPPGERLAFYQRLGAAETDEATYDVLQEMTDLYGTPPGEVENLVQLMLVKQRLSRLGALGLDYAPESQKLPPRIVVRFDPEEPRVTPDQLVQYVQKRPSARKLTPDGRLVVHLGPIEEPQEILQRSKDQMGELLRMARTAAA